MIRTTILGLLTALALDASVAAAPAPQQPVPAHIAAPPAAPKSPTTATAADASAYARRERKDPRVANYEGGSFVVIGISGSALVVLLLLLLLI